MVNSTNLTLSGSCSDRSISRRLTPFVTLVIATLAVYNGKVLTAVLTASLAHASVNTVLEFFHEMAWAKFSAKLTALESKDLSMTAVQEAA